VKLHFWNPVRLHRVSWLTGKLSIGASIRCTGDFNNARNSITVLGFYFYLMKSYNLLFGYNCTGFTMEPELDVGSLVRVRLDGGIGEGTIYSVNSKRKIATLFKGELSWLSKRVR
jgi:hypothetical protein